MIEEKFKLIRIGTKEKYSNCKCEFEYKKVVVSRLGKQSTAYRKGKKLKDCGQHGRK